MDDLTAEDVQNPPPTGAVVFTGSSTITLWNRHLQNDFSDVDVIGRGFGGSTIDLGLKYMDRIVIPYSPRLVVFYAGENDIASGMSPEQVADAFIEYSNRLLTALPDANLLYIAMKPSPLRWNIQKKFAEANALIEAHCAKTFRAAFLDMTPYMLGNDGHPRKDIFMKDGLHMNRDGYAIWREIIAPLLAPDLIDVRVPDVTMKNNVNND